MIKREIKRYENGMTHIHYNVPFLNTMSVTFFIGTGGLDEVDEKQFGISHFLEHMLFNGSENYPDAQKTLKEVSGRGMYQNAWTWTANTTYYLATPVEHFDFAFDVLFDRVYKPLLTEESIKKEIGVIQEEINMVYSVPTEYLGVPVFRKEFDGSSYGSDVIGTKESVGGMTKEGLREYHQAYYSPGNSICVTYGGIDFEAVEKSVRSKLGSLEAQKPITHTSELNQPTIHDKDFEGDTLTKFGDFDAPYYILVNHLELPKELSDFAKYIVLESILSNGQGSILDLEFRTREPLVSSGAARFLAFRKYLVSLIEFSFDLEQRQRFIEKIDKVLLNLSEYIDSESFNRGKEYAIGQLVRSIENVAFLTGAELTNIELYNEFTGNDNSIEDLLKAIKEVTIEQVQEIAKTAFSGKSTKGFLYPESMKGQL